MNFFDDIEYNSDDYFKYDDMQGYNSESTEEKINQLCDEGNFEEALTLVDVALNHSPFSADLFHKKEN